MGQFTTERHRSICAQTVLLPGGKFILRWARLNLLHSSFSSPFRMHRAKVKTVHSELRHHLNPNLQGYPWDWQVSKFNHKLSPKNVTDTNVRGTKATALNETVIEGDKASLNCHTRFLKGHTVSWLRKRDSSVLSVGLHTFSSDARISLEGAAFGNEEADWNLQVLNFTATLCREKTFNLKYIGCR